MFAQALHWLTTSKLRYALALPFLFFILYTKTKKSKEQELENYIFSLPREKLDQIRGKPDEVINVIDEYVEQGHFLMNIGKLKGKIISEKIQQVKPKVMIELGGYVGYSAILFGKQLTDPSAHYYSLEVNPKFAKIASKIIDLAGLSNKVTIIVGKATDSLVELRRSLPNVIPSFEYLDFVFIDHWKDLYVPDLRVMETLDLIGQGSIIAADNILRPGVPEYVKYVQGSLDYRKEYDSTVSNVNGPQFIGKWNIIYKSKTIKVDDGKREKDAVEITEYIEAK
ncbi:O-methyltransferase, human COMT catechol homolog 2 [Schizosaccharomyces pombe]|uniref:Probable catechol O-methyltransferase 2 n=1 Tax=Schizosaccharomyces pombe (strain 972 / ATCC 24843) TaxID=284812 RepID=COMT2_SCHPO|nr:catechol O-methyltransferase 2 [Schizosaccharomyces pombe]Q8NKC1.1 RecName: Full=Probable catechol O-methyltransferase 2 [Schizosaccharomyces pombe 972h-]CAD31744.1 human COMT ortholog 2 [Schizosaccharomyces pombe]|eukprot:NP_001018770.1 catechol O-methyltransferase 2 [Schizosaccharomyces pombe]